MDKATDKEKERQDEDNRRKEEYRYISNKEETKRHERKATRKGNKDDEFEIERD